MTKIEFIKEVAIHCELASDNLTINTMLKSIKGFDSFAVLSLIAFIDEFFNVKLTAKQIQELRDFASLIELIGENRFES